MSVGQRFKSSRLKANLSQAKLAKLGGSTQGVIVKIESDSVKHCSFMENFAKALDVDIEWLMTGKGFPKEDAVYPTKEIPVLMGHEIIKWCMNELTKDDISIPIREFTENPFKKNDRKRKFAIKIKDDTMSIDNGISFWPGSNVIIDPDRQWKDGDFILVIESSGLPMLIQYVTAGGEQLLKPLNTRYDIYPLTAEYIIIGTAVAQVHLLYKF